jgi:hypothetical protein
MGMWFSKSRNVLKTLLDQGSCSRVWHTLGNGLELHTDSCCRQKCLGIEWFVPVCLSWFACTVFMDEGISNLRCMKSVIFESIVYCMPSSASDHTGVTRRYSRIQSVKWQQRKFDLLSDKKPVRRQHGVDG